MDISMPDAPPIEAQRLTTWSVLPGGTHIRLDLVNHDGATHGLVLPVEDLSGLLMTLPRMLQAALDERFPDGSMRVVQQLGGWKLEQQEIDDRLILKLGTTDGFEIAFALNPQHADQLGAALLNPHSVKRLN